MEVEVEMGLMRMWRFIPWVEAGEDKGVQPGIVGEIETNTTQTHQKQDKTGQATNRKDEDKMKTR